MALGQAIVKSVARLCALLALGRPSRILASAMAIGAPEGSSLLMHKMSSKKVLPEAPMEDEEGHATANAELIMNRVTVGGKHMTRFPPVKGGGIQMNAQITGGQVCERDHYEESQVEALWRAHASTWTADAQHLCRKLNESNSDEWLVAVAGKAAPSTAIFSTLCKKSQAPQLLEPLAGILRSPRHKCQGRSHVMDVDWLVLADASSANLQEGTKRLLFDAGGSNFKDAMWWFTSSYGARGVMLDHIFVWEAAKRTTEAYWHGVPEEIRAQWEPRLTFYNGVPVTADPMDKDNNVVERIKKECSPGDFCAFKLDIDTPSVELPLVKQLLADAEAQARVDEFFFEHHVHGLMQEYWGTRVDGTFADSYDIFSKLRSKGIRAHSWV